MRSCATCKFYSALDTTCRFDPPKITPIPTAGGMVLGAVFPSVDKSTWCGKHETVLAED